MSNKGLTCKELSDHRLGLASAALCHRNLFAIALGTLLGGHMERCVGREQHCP